MAPSALPVMAAVQGTWALFRLLPLLAVFRRRHHVFVQRRVWSSVLLRTVLATIMDCVMIHELPLWTILFDHAPPSLARCRLDLLIIYTAFPYLLLLDTLRILHMCLVHLLDHYASVSRELDDLDRDGARTPRATPPPPPSLRDAPSTSMRSVTPSEINRFKRIPRTEALLLRAATWIYHVPCLLVESTRIMRAAGADWANLTTVTLAFRKQSVGITLAVVTAGTTTFLLFAFAMRQSNGMSTTCFVSIGGLISYFVAYIGLYAWGLVVLWPLRRAQTLVRELGWCLAWQIICMLLTLITDSIPQLDAFHDLVGTNFWFLCAEILTGPALVLGAVVAVWWDHAVLSRRRHRPLLDQFHDLAKHDEAYQHFVGYCAAKFCEESPLFYRDYLHLVRHPHHAATVARRCAGGMRKKTAGKPVAAAAPTSSASGMSSSMATAATATSQLTATTATAVSSIDPRESRTLVRGSTAATAPPSPPPPGPPPSDSPPHPCVRIHRSAVMTTSASQPAPSADPSDPAPASPTSAVVAPFSTLPRKPSSGLIDWAVPTHTDLPAPSASDPFESRCAYLHAKYIAANAPCEINMSAVARDRFAAAMAHGDERQGGAGEGEEKEWTAEVTTGGWD
ncbi:hypothetical protein AMAG_12656 [Allomyces macrogynus ATCC 38327]|uniref:RGS domain-containing protein n=1 Tax=Allomyces macrogynus (strain ATCC 38327) TaxID=578462 RepID=A0A0L0T1N1_ALLM3|nr:hypothetical protein AMAG_12656 [Allomyces macrogynus ATCC 38327]|eukprot:KNE68479.1 hypothetical protein AMAG_12656 [Allomyces macrogynus ATCC 38327]